MSKKTYPKKRIKHKKAVTARGSACSNRDCKLRKKGCSGFEGCPGYQAK